MDTFEINQQNNSPVVTKLPAKEQMIVTHETIIRPIDRQVKDIEYWRSGHIQAERVVYPNRVRLYDLYSDVELDGHLSGIWDRRKSAVANKKRHYYTPDGKIVEEIDELIKTMDFRNLIKALMEEKSHGCTGVQFLPGETFAWEPVNKKHIKPELGIVSIEQYGTEGYAYDELPMTWIVGEKGNFGFLLKCAPYALYKRGTMADWSQFSEIFGMPMRVAKYDSNDLKTKFALKTAMDEAGSALVMMIPKQAEFDIIDGKVSNADGSIYKNLKAACDEEMSIIILTVTETTVASRTSGYAQSKIHADQQLEVTKDDIQDIDSLLSGPKFQAILASYGYPVVEGGYFKAEEEINLEELTQRFKIDEGIAKKVPIGDDYWYETYGIPKPANYTALRAKMDAQAAIVPGADPEAGDPLAGDPAEDDPVASGGRTALSAMDRLRLAMARFFFQAREV